MDFTAYSKIGIVGGTFNPIHNGHLMIARCAKKQYPSLEAIVLLPNHLPSYKNQTSVITSRHRLSMLTLAIENEDDFFVSDIELARGGTTYTIDTLEQLHRLNPRLEISFIIGADSLLSFHKWYRYQDILKHCRILVAGRESERNKLKQFAGALLQDVGYGCIRIMRNKSMDISSSDIRTKISDGNIPYDAIPKKVADYIVEHKLYGLDDKNGSRQNIRKIKNKNK